MRYLNPVIPGFHPDPSCIRVGKDYYLVTSTFEYFPGVPVYHSRDLVHWECIGHCLTRASQLPLAGARCSGGIFAPTIRYHDGTFYMTVTNVTGGGNFYVTASDPAGPWSEPVWLDFPGIDPSIFFDDDGTVYYHGTGQGGGIWQTTLDVRTGKLLTNPRLIWPGTGGRYPEAPHLYRIDRTYYLMIAEGGTEYGHMETIARSDSPWGPFESCPRNPILTHRNRGQHEIQATGHAELFEAHDGNWWMVFLAIRNRAGRFHHLGRETFLTPVRWDDDGWPVVGNEGTVELEIEAPDISYFPPARPALSRGLRPRAGEQESSRSVESSVDPLHCSPVNCSPFSAEGRGRWNEAGLDPCWNFLRNPHEEDWSLTERRGCLRLKGSAATLSDLDSPAFIGRRQQHFDCRSSCVLEFEPKSANEEAGLVVLGNATHHYEIAVTRRDGKRAVIVRRRIGDLSAEAASVAIGRGPVRLIIKADAKEYAFGYSIGNSIERRLATGSTRYVSTEVCGGFTGVYLGMYATGNGVPCSVPADFQQFEYVS